MDLNMGFPYSNSTPCPTLLGSPVSYFTTAEADLWIKKLISRQLLIWAKEKQVEIAPEGIIGHTVSERMQKDHWKIHNQPQPTYNEIIPFHL